MSELLQDMYQPAVEDGVPADQYWSMTLEEILVQVAANQKEKLEETKRQANMDYRLAQMMTYAVNDPSKMPAFDAIYPFASEQEERTEEERAMEEMRAEQEKMMAMAQMIKATRARREAKENPE